MKHNGASRPRKPAWRSGTPGKTFAAASTPFQAISTQEEHDAFADSGSLYRALRVRSRADLSWLRARRAACTWPCGKRGLFGAVAGGDARPTGARRLMVLRQPGRVLGNSD